MAKTSAALLPVLLHSNLRSTTVIDLETPLGTLRLDLPGGPESVIPPNDPARTERAQKILEKASACMDQDSFDEADRLLLEAVSICPLIPSAYRTWLGISFQRQDKERIEYAFKQLFALDQNPFDLLQFAMFLGRGGRLQESETVLEYLWGLRKEIEPELGRDIADAFLITLQRQKNLSRMIEVAEQSIQRWGEQPAFLYQLLLAHLLQGDFDLVELKIPEARAKIPESSPFQERLNQMAAAVPQLRSAKKEG